MKSVPYFAVTSQQITTHHSAIVKLEGTLKSTATTGLFCQIHDSATVPANGAVPLKSWPADEIGYKEFKRGELQLANGLYICLSSTAATKTLATGGNDKYDILEVELYDPEFPTGTAIAGDLTTGVTHLDVWAENAGPKKLLKLTVISDSDDAWIMIFGRAFANIVSGTTKPIFSQKILSTTTKVLDFGDFGRDVLQQLVLVNYVGCCVAISTTAGVFTVVPSADFKIKAEYYPA